MWLVTVMVRFPAFLFAGRPAFLVGDARPPSMLVSETTKRNGEPGLKVSLREGFVRRMLVSPTAAKRPLLTGCGIVFRSVWNQPHIYEICGSVVSSLAYQIVPHYPGAHVGPR